MELEEKRETEGKSVKENEAKMEKKRRKKERGIELNQ